MQNQEKEKQMGHSREFKFRAWDKEQKKMLFNSESTPFNDSEAAFPDIVIDITHKHYGWEWMQYTGLKDKNGVEIYESDIVKETNNGSIAQVIWSNDVISDNGIVNGIFGDKVDLTGFLSNLGEFVFKWPPGKPHKAFSIQNLEIIGNIYEHPHLLTPENNK